ncbi:DUF4340 domain-containing protein [Leptospira fletcheri]|uniref:DUF4340 domain-containing protein n=1 Tax=Leptospira fletcheri TaxID=2484981 RepID=A0A4R9G3W7_9LEPT|nr:DUF4340 domain-containing protein [Leptospira fletcheri]TGK06196.1 DUF4340 domain-containing protein [Leptospira fletcheri]
MNVFRSAKTILPGLKANRGATFFAFNLLLAFLLLLVKDPWGCFQDTYSNSDPFFPLKESDIARIKVGRKGEIVSLSRTLDSWEVALPDGTTGPGDSERIVELLKAAVSLRKFTLLVRNSTFPSPEFGLSEDEPSLEIFDTSGKSTGILFIGSSAPRNSGVYVSEPEGRNIWLVKENLKTLIGNGRKDYFLSHSLFPDRFSYGKIRSLKIEFPSDPKKGFSLTSADNGWILSTNLFSKSVEQNTVNDFLEKLLGFKADEISLVARESLPLAPQEKFQIRLDTDSGTKILSPFGKDRQGSWIFRLSGMKYELIVDPWTMETILDKDLADFTSSPSVKNPVP